MTIPPPAPDARDWPSVVQFVQARRQREQQHVNQAPGNLHVPHAGQTITVTISVGVALLGGSNRPRRG